MYREAYSSNGGQLLANHYAALGLSCGATEDEIRKAHLIVVKDNHPDQAAGRPEAQALGEEALKAANVARDYLLNNKEPMPTKSEKNFVERFGISHQDFIHSVSLILG